MHACLCVCVCACVCVCVCVCVYVCRKGALVLISMYNAVSLTLVSFQSFIKIIYYDYFTIYAVLAETNFDRCALRMRYDTSEQAQSSWRHFHVCIRLCGRSVLSPGERSFQCGPTAQTADTRHRLVQYCYCNVQNSDQKQPKISTFFECIRNDAHAWGA